MENTLCKGVMSCWADNVQDCIVRNIKPNQLKCLSRIIQEKVWLINISIDLILTGLYTEEEKEKALIKHQKEVVDLLAWVEELSYKSKNIIN